MPIPYRAEPREKSQTLIVLKILMAPEQGPSAISVTRAKGEKKTWASVLSYSPESGATRGHDATGDLRMPMTFLDGVGVMQEQQGRRYVRHPAGLAGLAGLVIVQLDGQVPEGEGVVGGGDGDDGILLGMPFDRRDGLAMEAKTGDGARVGPV